MIIKNYSLDKVEKQFLESLLDLRYAIFNLLSIVSDFQRLVAAPFNMQFEVEAIYQKVLIGFETKMFSHALKLS